jgi:DNA invertase Pin-like site-specific DNA recombinase
MDQYVRVSRVGGRSGESFISPDLQRDQGAAWAASRSVEIPMIHEDLDQSGGKLARPGLDALMARIRAGETDGVIVSKLDRLSRLGVADALRLVEQITEAGGSIAALDLGLDPTTPFGEFGMTIMLALARMERRRMSEAWEHAKTRALDRGARMGPTPFGYTRDDDGLLVPHPKWARVVNRASSSQQTKAPTRRSTTCTSRCQRTPPLVGRACVTSAAPIIGPGTRSPCDDCCATGPTSARRATATGSYATRTRPWWIA